MLHGKSPTLSWYAESPYTRPINVGTVPAPVVAINCSAFRHDPKMKMAVPETEALDFYAMNHFMALVHANFTKNEVLPDWAEQVAHTYSKVLERQGTRMTFYMLLVTVRESRHVKTPSNEETFWADFRTKFGKPAYDFNRMIKGSGSEAAAQAYLDTPPETWVGRFSKSLTHIFFHGSFSGGYGGKPWGMISQTLDQMLNGETSLEVMLDTAYTLAHNNGPMFNKGMLYQMYCDEIYTILDVQRSGQVPEYLISGKLGKIGRKASKDVYHCLELVRKHLPNEIGEEVSWQKVKDLGGLKNYSSEIAQQKAKEPPKPDTNNQGYLITGELTLMPGKSVNLYTRKAQIASNGV